MRPPAEGPPGTRRAAALLLLLGILAGRAAAAGYLDLPEKERPFRPFVFLAGSVDLNATFGAAVFCEPWRSWQGGLETRNWGARGERAYDFLPEINLLFRKLWLSAEERESMRSSEYLGAAAGFYPAYRELGPGEPSAGVDFRPGMRPVIKAMIGKYWMPARTRSWGLDINVLMAHSIFNLHPPGYRDGIDYFTVTLSIFWLP